jgi:predicted S18 family serine protease
MKKILLLLIVFMAGAAAAFTQSFTVQNISGRVERETSGGRWEAIKAGDTLPGETVIRTGIGARLTLALDGRTFSIGAVQTGPIASLAGNTAGIRIDGRVAQTDTGEMSLTTGRISTASARASDAAAEEDIAAE